MLNSSNLAEYFIEADSLPTAEDGVQKMAHIQPAKIRICPPCGQVMSTVGEQLRFVRSFPASFSQKTDTLRPTIDPEVLYRLSKPPYYFPLKEGFSFSAPEKSDAKSDEPIGYIALRVFIVICFVLLIISVLILFIQP